ncbi:MAG: RNA polymerase sigma factor [Oscillospiraceae bacterium]
MENLETLTLRAKEGDKAAFEKIYLETYRSVYFTCIGFLKNEADAKDITQETYLTALEKIDSLEDKSRISPWLNRIAVNKCRDLLKKKTPEYLDEETLENLPAEESENFLPEDYITDREKRQIVMDIMRRVLSDIQYQTVIMFYFNEMTAAEIAGIMNCPVGTVTYRLSAARAKIKEGVLDYENENDQKLHGVVGIPFLTRLLKAEAESLDIPPFSPDMFADKTNKKSPVNNAAKNAENGAKKMLNTLKAKVITGVVAAAVVGGGVTAGVMLNNKNNIEPDDEQDVSVTETIENSEQSEVSEESESDVSEEVSQADESSETAPKYTGTRLWIDDVDLTNPLSEQPDLKIGDMFGGTLDLPLTTEQLEERYDFYYFGNGKTYCSTIGQALTEGGPDERKHDFSIYCKPKTSDDEKGYQIDVMNYADDDSVTFENCYYNNWWRISEVYSYQYKELLDPEGVVEDYDDSKALLENFMKTVGSPNYFSTVTSPFEDFEATRHDDNSLHGYYLGWIFDDYVILVSLYDGIYYGKNSLEISLSNICRENGGTISKAVL